MADPAQPTKISAPEMQWFREKDGTLWQATKSLPQRIGDPVNKATITNIFHDPELKAMVIFAVPAEGSALDKLEMGIIRWVAEDQVAVREATQHVRDPRGFVAHLNRYLGMSEEDYLDLLEPGDDDPPPAAVPARPAAAKPATNGAGG